MLVFSILYVFFLLYFIFNRFYFIELRFSLFLFSCIWKPLHCFWSFTCFTIYIFATLLHLLLTFTLLQIYMHYFTIIFLFQLL